MKVYVCKYFTCIALAHIDKTPRNNQKFVRNAA
jgi:hypothetical protein